MLKLLKNTSTFFVVIIMVSCSPRLTGTWSVQRYEAVTPGEQGVTMTNIGTMTFNRNGTGEKNLNYNALGVQRSDNFPFAWSQKDKKYLIIEGENSEFIKTWIIIENKRKSQKWKSTDGSSNVQILELKK